MRVNFFENGFQKIPIYIDLLLSFKAKVYLPDSILKAELLGVFELLAQQNWTIHQVRRMISTVNQGIKVSGNWLIKFPPLITRYVKWKPPAEESEHGFFHLSTRAGKTAPFHQPVPVISRESKAQHKELFKILTLCEVTKDDVRQGHFHLECLLPQHHLCSDTSTEQICSNTNFPSNPSHPRFYSPN